MSNGKSVLNEVFFIHKYNEYSDPYVAREFIAGMILMAYKADLISDKEYKKMNALNDKLYDEHKYQNADD